MSSNDENEEKKDDDPVVPWKKTRRKTRHFGNRSEFVQILILVVTFVTAAVELIRRLLDDK